jgi:hypothetical protein
VNHDESPSGATEPAAVPSTSTELVASGVRQPARRGSAVAELTGQAALGLALVVGEAVSAVISRVDPRDQGTPVDERHDPVVAGRRIALGVGLELQRATIGLAEAGSRLAGPTARWLLANPLLQPAFRAVNRSLDAAYERGRVEEEVARDVVTRAAEESVSLAVPVVLANVDIDPVIQQVLASVDLRPIVDRVLGDLDLPELVEGVMADLDLDPIVQRVLAQLDLPDLVQQVVGELQMSSVVLEATGGITTEILAEVRDRSARADGSVEQAIGRVLRRGAAQGPATTSSDVPVGEP